MDGNEKVSLIIHGPLDKYSLFSINKYKSLHDIILVFPKPKTEEQKIIFNEVSDVVFNSKNNMSMVVYNNIVPEKVNNDQNRYLHFLSTFTGLQMCKTEYAIKLRSDEFYSDLTPFITVMNEYSTKLVTTEVFFRNSSMLFHPSDHLVGGKTKLMKKVFGLAKDLTENPEKKYNNTFLSFIHQSTKHENYVTEQLLGAAVLTVKYPTIELEEIKPIEMMKDSFHIVKTDTLGNFRIAANTQITKEFFDNSFFKENSDINDISYYK